MVGSDNYSRPQLKPEALKSLSAKGLLSLWAIAEWQNLTKKNFQGHPLHLIQQYPSMFPVVETCYSVFVCVYSLACTHLHMLVYPCACREQNLTLGIFPGLFFTMLPEAGFLTESGVY